MVMYAGKTVEMAANEQIFGGRGPMHPYTRMLLDATPRLHPAPQLHAPGAAPEQAQARGAASVLSPELAFIPGAPPDLLDPPPGCRFAARCPSARRKCARQEPPLTALEEGHTAACWKAMKDPEYERS